MKKEDNLNKRCFKYNPETSEFEETLLDQKDDTVIFSHSDPVW